MNIKTFNSPFLKRKSVDFSFDKDIKTFILNMFYVMYNSGGVGLAAPQVGENVNIFIIDEYGDLQNPMLFINPQLKLSGDLIKDDEGCLSYPGAKVIVERNDIVEVTYKNIKNSTNYLKTSGWLSRIIQHEYDHLIGKTLGDKLSSVEKSILIKKQKQNIKEKFSLSAIEQKTSLLLNL